MEGMNTNFQGLILQGHSASNSSWEIEAEENKGVTHAVQDSTENILTQWLNYTCLPPGLIWNVIKMCCDEV